MLRSEAVIDCSAISANVETVRTATTAAVMAVVKADGYGHGMLPAARAAVRGGASWLGVAHLDEALALRRAGFTQRTLAWLWTPQEAGALRDALAAGVDVSVSSQGHLDLVVATAAEVGTPARVHLKADTGLSRNGATVADWPELVTAAAKAAATGVIETAGIWSHLARSDEPDEPSNDLQLARFHEALSVAAVLGVAPEVRHLANSAAILTRPDMHFDLVRAGISLYGLSPVPERGQFGLVPAMTLRSHLANVKRVPSGEGVSYGHRYVTAAETTLALVPLGYGDGIPRAAGGAASAGSHGGAANAGNRGGAASAAPVAIGGRRYPICGRVAMDQFVVDIGDAAAAIGDEVVLFGPGDSGEPLAQDWADALDTIHYEVVTRIGARVPRTYLGDASGAGS